MSKLMNKYKRIGNKHSKINIRGEYKHNNS